MDVGKENRNFGKGITKDALKTMFSQDSRYFSNGEEKE